MMVLMSTAESNNTPVGSPVLFERLAEEGKRFADVRRDQRPAVRLAGMFLEGMGHVGLRERAVERLDPFVEADALVVAVRGSVVEIDLELVELAAAGQLERVVSVPELLVDRVAKQRPEQADEELKEARLLHLLGHVERVLAQEDDRGVAGDGAVAVRELHGDLQGSESPHRRAAD